MSSIVQHVVEGFLASYLLLVVGLIWGWIKAQHQESRRAEGNDSGTKLPMVSVVVAARNESGCVPLLIRDLRAQRMGTFEVIVVDDHSEDDTVRQCMQAIQGDDRFVVVKSGGKGKKEAISTGIRRANGSIVVTTDADCRVGPVWISTLTQAFADPATMMVFGPVCISGSSLFERMQTIEFATLIGAGAATSAWNAPTMCNGANLAYRKHAFETLNGYSGNFQIPSGDDEFLMRKVKAAYPGSIHFCGAREALVTTQASPDARKFFDQRIRWAGKWRLSHDPTSTLLALAIFSFHAVIVLLPWLTVTGAIRPEVAVVAMASKVIVELIYIKSIQRALGFRWSWTAFFMLQIVYSYYVVVVAACAQFIGFEWKGRRLRPFMVDAIE